MRDVEFFHGTMLEFGPGGCDRRGLKEQWRWKLNLHSLIKGVTTHMDHLYKSLHITSCLQKYVEILTSVSFHLPRPICIFLASGIIWPEKSVPDSPASTIKPTSLVPSETPSKLYYICLSSSDTYPTFCPVHAAMRLAETPGWFWRGRAIIRRHVHKLRMLNPLCQFKSDCCGNREGTMYVSSLLTRVVTMGLLIGRELC